MVMIIPRHALGWLYLGEGRAPRAYVLDRFSWIKIMNSDTSVYVFVSADGAFRGLSRLPDGVNLPQTDCITWLPNDTIPLTLSALGRFVENSAVRYPCHVCLIDATGSGRLTACSYEERSEP